MLCDVRGGTLLAIKGMGPNCRSGQLTSLGMYPGHVSGLKKLYHSAVVTIVLSKDSRWRKQGHWGGSTDVLDPSVGGKGPFRGRWPCAEEEWFPLSPLSGNLSFSGGRKGESFPAPSQE